MKSLKYPSPRLEAKIIFIVTLLTTVAALALAINFLSTKKETVKNSAIQPQQVVIVGKRMTAQEKSVYDRAQNAIAHNAIQESHTARVN